jgi:hypothetical protein
MSMFKIAEATCFKVGGEIQPNFETSPKSFLEWREEGRFNFYVNGPVSDILSLKEKNH